MTSKEKSDAKVSAKQIYNKILKRLQDSKLISLEELSKDEDYDLSLAQNDKQDMAASPQISESNSNVFSFNKSRVAPNSLALNPYKKNLFANDVALSQSEKKVFVDQIVIDKSMIHKAKKKLITNQPKSLDTEIVIEGQCLTHLLHPENRRLFAKIIKKAGVVLVCRASPNQKAEIVQFVKQENPKIVSLAIGDGFNDVNMIQTADVGVGVFGKEGNQAVSAADYGIGEFKFLRRLLMVHGRYNVRRITNFLYQFFVKSQVFTFMQLLFAFYNGYSGQNYWEPAYIVAFNLVGAHLIVGYAAAMDQDISPKLEDSKTRALLPYLYMETRDKYAFNLIDFSCWYLYGVYYSLVIFYIPFISYSATISSSGLTYDLWQIMFSSYCGLAYGTVAITMLYMYIYDVHTLSYLVAHFLLFYPFFVMLYDSIPGHVIYKSQFEFYNTILFWLVLLCTLCASLLPLVFVKHLKTLFLKPTLAQLVMAKRLPEGVNIEQKLRTKEQDLSE